MNINTLVEFDQGTIGIPASSYMVQYAEIYEMSMQIIYVGGSQYTTTNFSSWVSGYPQSFEVVVNAAGTSGWLADQSQLFVTISVNIPDYLLVGAISGGFNLDIGYLPVGSEPSGGTYFGSHPLGSIVWQSPPGPNPPGCGR